jgi:hypothetical protein
VPGSIRRRQTTYWDLDFRDTRLSRTRVHFIGKVEFHYVSPAFSEASLYQEHPLLADYREPSLQLFVNHPASEPEILMEQLSGLVRAWSQGWRSLHRYQNSQSNPHRILATGSGLLMSGPRTLVNAAEAMLAEHGAEPTSLPPSHTPGRQLQALCLGLNFVIACHFDFESLNEAAA